MLGSVLYLDVQEEEEMEFGEHVAISPVAVSFHVGTVLGSSWCVFHRSPLGSLPELCSQFRLTLQCAVL